MKKTMSWYWHFFSFIRQTKPLMEPDMLGCYQYRYQYERPLVSKYEDKILNICIPLLVCSNSLQQNTFSWISSSLTNLTKTSWYLLVNLVTHQFGSKMLFFSLSQKISPVSRDMSSIQRHFIVWNCNISNQAGPYKTK